MATALEGIQSCQLGMHPLFALVSINSQHTGSSQAFQQRTFQVNSARYDYF